MKPRRLGFVEGPGKGPDDIDTFMQDETAGMFYGIGDVINSPGLILTSPSPVTRINGCK